MFNISSNSLSNVLSSIQLLSSRISSISAISTKVGLPSQSADYPSGASVLLVASVHEFGLGSTPQRSFIRSTILEKKNDYKAQIRRNARDVVSGRITARAGAMLLGETVKSDMIEKISSNIPPGLSESTKRSRRHNTDGNYTALIDTGHLRSQIEYQISDD